MDCNGSYRHSTFPLENLNSVTSLLAWKQVTDKLYHITLYTSPWSGFELTTSVLICTDCIGSCKSNYHTVTPTAVQGKCECPTDHWLIFPSLGPAKRIGFEFISFPYEIFFTQQFHVFNLKLCISTMYVSRLPERTVPDIANAG